MTNELTSDFISNVALVACECCGAATPEGPSCLCDTCDAAMHAEVMEGHADDFEPGDDSLLAEIEAGEWDDDNMDEYDNGDEDEQDADDFMDEYDGQPDEYTEWQDFMGGDDWDHGQYDGDY